MSYKKWEAGDYGYKEVIAVYVDKKFKQYLKKSEIRFLVDIMKDNKGIIGVQIDRLPNYQYNLEFK